MFEVTGLNDDAFIIPRDAPLASHKIFPYSPLPNIPNIAHTIRTRKNMYDMFSFPATKPLFLL